MGAGGIIFNIDARATARAAHLFDVYRQRLNLMRLQTADEIFLAQELRKADQAAMPVQAAIVGKAAAILR